MSTGVRSTIILETRPPAQELEAFVGSDGRVVTVTDMSDGRIHLESFTPLRCDRHDLVSALREISVTQQAAMATLRHP